jgi:hypothetical protein
MCNLYSITINQAAIVALFRVVNRPLSTRERQCAPHGHPLMSADGGRSKRSLHFLFGFLLGCAIAAAAISVMAEWIWPAAPAASWSR